ncbi:hypothetical protein C3O70_22195, partial [Cronobacter sakazakii]
MIYLNSTHFFLMMIMHVDPHSLHLLSTLFYYGGYVIRVFNFHDFYLLITFFLFWCTKFSYPWCNQL